MGAVSAIRSDADFRELYARLTGEGEPPKVGIVAVMNKIMRRIAALAKLGTPWVKT